VDDAGGVAGFILPNHRVDLMLTVTGGNPNEALTKLIMQNLVVVAAGPVLEKDVKGEVIQVPTLTLLVTPEDAEKLKHAETQGRMTFALKNAGDVKTVRTAGAQLRHLLAGTSSAPARGGVRTAPAPVLPAAPQQICVDVIKNGTRQRQCFGGEGRGGAN
jgi:pilus assembly protein CpaB